MGMMLIALWISSTVYSSGHCIYDNVALGKPAHQTGVSLGHGPELAVDGRLCSTNGDDSHCALVNHSDPGGLAEWWVDLQDLHFVYNITVHNTFYTWAYTRMTDFCLGVILPGRPEVCCGRRLATVPQGGSATFTCPPGSVGRYVHFSRLGGGPSPSRVTLCEVEVIGKPLVPKTTRSQDDNPTEDQHKDQCLKCSSDLVVSDHIPNTRVGTQHEIPITWPERDTPTPLQDSSLTLARKATDMCEPGSSEDETGHETETESRGGIEARLSIDAVGGNNASLETSTSCKSVFCGMIGMFGASLTMTGISTVVKIVVSMKW